jgi:Protein of unknown function (DUF3995)
MATTTAPPPTPVPRLDHDVKQRPALRWPLALCAWSLLYMLPHLYWALGGDALLFMVKHSAAEMDDWQAINLAASVVLTGAALIGPALIWFTARPRLRAATLATCVAGAAIAGSHGAFGIIYRALNVAGVTDLDGTPFDASRHEWALWDLFIFEPWFLIEGVLFMAAGATALKTTQTRSRWTVGCLVAIGIATLTGLIGLRV